MGGRVGQLLGNYRLIRLLGRGGFAEVYLGKHIYIETQAAVKVLSTPLVGEYLQRFIREAKIVASLEHPHIVRVLDFGIEEEKETPFLVMSYAAHGTMRQRYPKESTISLDEVLSYVQHIAPALQYAHDRKIIHRDIKPENMLVGNQGEILLSDFGIAMITATSISKQAKTTAGTVVYMAPEQISGKPCRASDQYALGVVVYEWLCGQPPFQGSFFEICAQHLHSLIPSLRKKRPEIPLEVEQCIIKALAKDPQERFANVQDFAWALQEAGRRAIDAYTFTSLQRHLQEPLDFNTSQATSTFLNARSSRVAHLDQYDTMRLKATLKISSLSNANQDDPTFLNARLALIQTSQDHLPLQKRSTGLITPIILQSHLITPSMPLTPLTLQKHNYRIKSTLIIVSCIILLAVTAGSFLNPNRFIIAKNDHASTSDFDNHRYPQKFETHSSVISNPPVFVVPNSPAKSSHRTGTFVEQLPTSIQTQEPTQPAISQQPQISQLPAVSQQPPTPTPTRKPSSSGVCLLVLCL